MPRRRSTLCLDFGRDDASRRYQLGLQNKHWFAGQPRKRCGPVRPLQSARRELGTVERASMKTQNDEFPHHIPAGHCGAPANVHGDCTTSSRTHKTRRTAFPGRPCDPLSFPQSPTEAFVKRPGDACKSTIAPKTTMMLAVAAYRDNCIADQHGT